MKAFAFYLPFSSFLQDIGLTWQWRRHGRSVLGRSPGVPAQRSGQPGGKSYDNMRSDVLYRNQLCPHLMLVPSWQGFEDTGYVCSRNGFVLADHQHLGIILLLLVFYYHYHQQLGMLVI